MTTHPHTVPPARPVLTGQQRERLFAVLLDHLAREHARRPIPIAARHRAVCARLLT